MSDKTRQTRRYAGPRRHPAHRPTVRLNNRPVIVHVTVNVTHRREILANRSVHDALLNAWAEADHWVVGTYMIMPDHLHLFAAPGRLSYPAIRQWAGYWKRVAGEGLPLLKSAWLKDCWDTQMRNLEHYRRKLEYVRENPVRKGLVERSEDWPHQGAVVNLDWIAG